MKYKIGLGIILMIILGYLIGQWIPIEYLRPTIENKPIETKDYYSLVVQIIAAVATFLAVIAALFREEIRRLWEYVKIDYSIPEEKFIEVLNPNIGNAGVVSTPIEAEKYRCEIEVMNNGTISSHSSEIIVESVNFKHKDLNSSQPLETIGTPLFWGSTQEQRITIPPKGKKRIIILEVIPPDTESSPDGSETESLPSLSIMGVKTEIVNNTGTWSATYLLHSTNSKPKRFYVDIKWNGQWHGRKTEMNKCLTIELKG
ncbi:hypothetical protein [Flagellimonas sp.]|uniref:hypothetical protein n=1 Tax=Flagellimonas sp. TaxID=2058762 RepID=UPI003BAAD008